MGTQRGKEVEFRSSLSLSVFFVRGCVCSSARLFFLFFSFSILSYFFRACTHAVHATFLALAPAPAHPSNPSVPHPSSATHHLIHLIAHPSAASHLRIIRLPPYPLPLSSKY